MNKINKIFFLEIFLLTLLWLASLWMSHGYFNRPLGVHHEWETGHVLSSMRAYEEWGFWKVMGASILLPHSKEWQNLDMAKHLADVNKIIPVLYLSSPSWYIIFPYLTWKILNLIPFVKLPISAFFLESFNLAVSRLFTGIIFYYLFLEITKLFMPKNSGTLRQKTLAFMGTAAWMLCPAVLYFTQNTYFGEKSFLGFEYAIILMALKCRFQFDKLSIGGKLLLFILSFIACGTSYFGLLCILFLCPLVLVNKPPVPRYFTGYLATIAPMALGTLAAITTFIVQLLHFKGGFALLFERFHARTGTIYFNASAKVPLSFAAVFNKINSHWDNFLPFGTLYRHEFYICADFLLFAAVMYYLLAARTKNKTYVASVFCLIYILPLCYIFILKNWAYDHDFSGQIMSFPIAFSWSVLPFLLLHRWKFSGQTLVAMAVLVFAISTQSKNLSVNFAEKGSDLYMAIGKIIARDVGKNDLLVILPWHPLTGTEGVNLKKPSSFFVFIPLSPLTLWYSDRYVYKEYILYMLLSKKMLSYDRLKNIPLALIGFNLNEKPDERINLVIEKNMIEINEKLEGKPIFLYRPRHKE